MYQTLAKTLSRAVPKHLLFKHLFNFAPMYRRTSARLVHVSTDLQEIRIEIPLTWKTRNYVGTMFGGAMLAATDPIYMVQLLNIIGDEFIVWDKSVEFRFRRPAKSTLSATFAFDESELNEIRAACERDGSIDIKKRVELIDEDGEVVGLGTKVLYVATRAFQKEKQARRDQASVQ